LCGLSEGPHTIKFADGDRIEYSLVGGEVSGVIFGDRVMSYAGTYKVKYPAANLEAEIKLHSSGGLFSATPAVANRVE
jgi:hypothetical protein